MLYNGICIYSTAVTLFGNILLKVVLRWHERQQNSTGFVTVSQIVLPSLQALPFMQSSN